MRYRVLGRTGLKTSEIGIGGIGAMGKYGPVAANGTSATDPGEPTESYRNIPHFEVALEGFAKTMGRAEDLGVNFLDTAPSYGHSEETFGYYLKNKAHRKNWIVCTKTGVCGSWGGGDAMDTRQIFEQADSSLKQLQIDQIDILLIHSIDQYGQGEQAVERVVKGGMVDALKDLKAAGKIRFFGVSGQLPELTAAAGTGLFDVTLTYNTFNLLVRDADDEFLPLAIENDLGVLLGGVFHYGLLAGEANCYALQDIDRFFEQKDPGKLQAHQMFQCAQRLKEFAGGGASDLRRLGMRFALSSKAISTIVSGIKNAAEIEENVDAVEAGPLTDSEQAELAEVIADMPRISWKA